MRPRGQLRRTRAALLLALVPGALGIALSHWPRAARLEKNGLDTLFQLRGERQPPPAVCVVAIDLASYREIGRPPAASWPRALHADLIRTLKREGARAVAFDVTFEGASDDPRADEALRSAIEEAGNVVLGASVEIVEDPRFKQATVIEPYEPLARAAADVADVNLPIDEGVIRLAWPARDEGPGLALAAYEVATGDASARSTDPWILEYYGPARTIPTVSMYQALDPSLLAPGFFRDKIVFVGLSMDSAPGDAKKDAFLTPFSQHGSTTFGVEIHATLAANFLERRRIELLDPRVEAVLLLLFPLVAVLVFMSLRPLLGAGALAILAIVPWAVAYVAFTRRGLWLPVAIPSLIQMPTAYAASLLWYYLTTLRDREKIKRVFGFYLAPEMIRQIAEDPDAVNLGGREIVGTALFTDIKGFTPIAEGMSAPETAAMLNAYFSEATRHVFDAGGTLIKYIGDAVFAIWGAPVRRDDHATQACIAALSLSRAEQASRDGGGPASRLVTRIGVHTGPMLVGNLGSSQRFDYTAIGDAVNLASRIEGLNKTFGTRALTSGETLAATDGRFVTRRLGRVRVVGRREPVELHELIALKEDAAGAKEVLDTFARAHEAWVAGRFDEAARGFREALRLSGDSDGPSEFFARDSEARAVAATGAWDGVLSIETK